MHLKELRPNQTLRICKRCNSTEIDNRKGIVELKSLDRDAKKIDILLFPLHIRAFKVHGKTSDTTVLDHSSRVK